MFRNGFWAIFLIIMFLTGELVAIYLNLPKLSLADNEVNLNSAKTFKANLHNIIMPKVQAQKNQELKPQQILFVGDIMLDRNVEALMKKNGDNYPFEKIKDFLADQDLVVANLEGPIVKSPENFGEHALKFAFNAQTSSVLKGNHINLISLANNHILNMGQSGLKETKEYLMQSQINYFGDPLLCTQDFIYAKDNLLFLGYNKTFSSSCQDADILNGLKETKLKNPDKFIIVNMHWGSEYKTVNSKAQQDLAHQLIEAGADLIIGHHPHVVQNIELYKNKLIFYSLGNFIFDQYFSKNVQQGLAVGLEIYKDKQVYTIYPIQSVKSQPNLMSDEDKAKFLADLAARSSEELSRQINLGKIELKSNL